MNELNLTFNEYYTAFKKLSINEKRAEIINSLNEMVYIFVKLAESDNIPLTHLFVEENKNIISEDDFLDAGIVWIENAKNIIGQYLENKNL